MSQENVEIVRAAHPPSGAELTSLFADDSGASKRLQAIAPLFDAEFEFVAHAGIGQPTSGSGLQELVEAWRDWMQPFETWRTEVEGFAEVDDDRVLVLIRDHVRPRGGDAEIESLGCNLWTLRNGKVARIDFYPTRSEGLKAAGLSE
jgi:SnoaL-like domain